MIGSTITHYRIVVKLGEAGIGVESSLMLGKGAVAGGIVLVYRGSVSAPCSIEGGLG